MRFFADNCLPAHLAEMLNAVAKATGDAVVHLQDRYPDAQHPESVEDVTWIADLAADGPWFI